MESKIPANPYSAASPPPENLLNTPRHRFPNENYHPQTPLITNLYASDQAIESAFSRLTISPGFQAPLAQTPPFAALPTTFDSVAAAEFEKQQALIWAQSQSNNGGANGPFALFGPHQNVNVGPGEMGFWGTGPYLDAGDHQPLKSLKHSQRQDFFDATYDNYDPFFVHGKKPFSRKSNFQSNFCGSRPSVYSGHQLTLENMRGRIVSMANNQVLSGFLNLKLEKEGLSEAEIEIILQEVVEFLGDLMRNQFGSNFVQNLFVACNEDQRTRMIMALTKFPFKLVTTCLNSYGARAMQKLLEKLITPQQISLIVSALSPGAVALATDSNGQHVLQYCVKNFPGEYNKHLFNEIADNCFKIATNKSGCCVLQSCVENSRGEARQRLISEIVANAIHLAEDPYGNYVVQHLLGMRMQDATAELLRRFRGCFATFSCNKYASNVVEKFVLESGENHSATVIRELLTSPNASMLLLDPYGNFVIQSALSVSKGQVRDALLKLIQVNMSSMQSNLYGKKILAWFEKRRLHNA